MNVIDITPTVDLSKKNIRLAAYCRVSSNSEDQIHSFAAQIQYYKVYEQKNPQYKLVDIYADEGITGTSMKNRDELLRLLQDCKRGLIDRIIVKSVSRFARNTEELLVTLRMLKELGVSVFFEEQCLDTDKLNMEMIVTFPGMAAQQESESISGNLHWSYQKRMESGEFNCCAPPYGFLMKNGQLEVYEPEAEVIRRIFNLYLAGEGMQGIANILNQEKVPRRYGQEKWYRFTVKYVLNNERYMGDALLQKCFTPEVLPYRHRRNHGQRPQYYVENANPPIVTKETYQKAQALIRLRRTSNDGKITRFPLSGILRCPDCGKAFRRLATENGANWVCSYGTSRQSNCKIRRVKERAVYDSFQILMMKLSENRQVLFEDTICMMQEAKSTRARESMELNGIDKEIADLSAKKLVLTRLHTGGIMNSTEYAIQTAQLSNKISHLRAKKKKVIAKENEADPLIQMKEMLELLETYDISSDFDEETFSYMVQSIKVIDNARLRFKIVGDIELEEIIEESERCMPS